MDSKKAFYITVSLALIIIFFELGILFQMPFKTKVIKTTPLTYEKIDPSSWDLPEKQDMYILITRGIAVYTENGTTYGEILPIEMQLNPGTGRISTDITTAIIGEELQLSLMKAIYFAEDYSQKSLDYDVNLRIISQASHIDGGSATAAMSTTLIAFLQNKEFKKNVFILADMDMNGTLQNITNINARVETAIDNGIELVIIPKQQCNEIETNKTTVLCTDNLRKTISNLIE